MHVHCAAFIKCDYKCESCIAVNTFTIHYHYDHYVLARRNGNHRLCSCETLKPSIRCPQSIALMHGHWAYRVTFITDHCETNGDWWRNAADQPMTVSWPLTVTVTCDNRRLAWDDRYLDRRVGWDRSTAERKHAVRYWTSSVRDLLKHLKVAMCGV